jgi:hypothetical protein
MQQQENLVIPQFLSNKCRMMVMALADPKTAMLNKAEILDLVYTATGSTDNLDGTRVCL